jgi:hypothetical protein
LCVCDEWKGYPHLAEWTRLSLSYSPLNASTDNETFDLAGKNASTIENAVQDAFREAFALPETIRLTFVTGAGKLARQKYDDGAAKAITSPLRELGYQEDHGGGAGTFKLQHDTGKNLKTVVVYPHVSKSGGESENTTKVATAALLAEDSAEYKIAYSSANVFQRMVESKCPTWSQKKGCVAAVETVKSMVQVLETKLLTGTPLSESEQDFYDAVSITSLEEKLTLLKELMHAQVDTGKITSREKIELLAQVNDRLATLRKDIVEAESEGKAKRVDNLKNVQTKATARKEKLESISPQAPPLLKNILEINKLRTEMAPLLEMEESAKGRLLTLKESQAIGRKDEIQEEIEDLERSSRGWFESDDAFATRVEAACVAWKAAARNKKPTKKKPVGSVASGTASAPKWVTPAPKKSAWSKAPTKSKPAGGGVFAAMMMDSDSD